MNASITLKTYGALQESYDHFNGDLFDGRLLEVLFTLNRKNPQSAVPSVPTSRSARSRRRPIASGRLSA